MNDPVSRLSAIARKAVQAGEWATVHACAGQILQQDRQSAEGHFFAGLVDKAAGRPQRAAESFSRALAADAGRYDAAIELAYQYAVLLRHAEARALLRQYEAQLGNSPIYLDLAANVYVRLGLHACAWPLYRKANALQPGIDRFQANLAACAVFVGEIETATSIYKALLQKNPSHQKNHYELSRLGTARDASHVEQMQAILAATGLPAEKNIFLYYAIGKELEDLERWSEAFDYYRLAGDAVTRLANYDVGTDIDIIDKVIEVCNADWLATGKATPRPDDAQSTPIFVVGLPRTGTTLTERIISSHSQVESAGESMFMQIALQRVSGRADPAGMSPAIIEAAAGKAPGLVGKQYLDAVAYRLDGLPMFVEKYPENFRYLGFIARDFPAARIVHLRREPMDACFALYKQSFFKYAYTLENLGKYYVACDRLYRHWQAVLGERLIEVKYESLVNDQEGQTRRLLDKLGLAFEPACLAFEKNRAPSATASSVQVLEKMHNRSVGKWKKFARPLQPLQRHLEKAGIL